MPVRCTVIARPCRFSHHQGTKNRAAQNTLDRSVMFLAARVICPCFVKHGRQQFATRALLVGPRDTEPEPYCAQQEREVAGERRKRDEVIDYTSPTKLPKSDAQPANCKQTMSYSTCTRGFHQSSQMRPIRWNTNTRIQDPSPSSNLETVVNVPDNNKKVGRSTKACSVMDPSGNNGT